jgi:HEAT repeat protein
MLRHAVALLLTIASGATTGFAAENPAEMAAETTPSTAEILAAARAADFFYQNHLARLTDDLAAPDQATRSRALATLGRLGDPDTVALLIPILEGKVKLPPADLIAACQAAAALGQPAATAPLIRSLLTHPDPDVRIAAYNALSVLAASNPGDSTTRAKDAAAVLNGAAKTDLGIYHQAEAAEILGQALAKDPRPHVRRMAAIGLGRIGTPELGPALQAGLTDPDPQVRGTVAASLAKIQYTPAVPFILIALESDIATVELAAALKSLAGDDFGYNPKGHVVERTDAVNRGFAWWAAQQKTN